MYQFRCHPWNRTPGVILNCQCMSPYSCSIYTHKYNIYRFRQECVTWVSEVCMIMCLCMFAIYRAIKSSFSCGDNYAPANTGLHSPIAKYHRPRSMIKHGCKLNVTCQLGKSNQIMPCSILVQSRVWHWEWMWGQYRVIIYHSQALPVTAKEEPVVPYCCLKTYSLFWKKADNISVLRFTLCTSLLVGLKSLVQMDTGQKIDLEH